MVVKLTLYQYTAFTALFYTISHRSLQFISWSKLLFSPFLESILEWAKQESIARVLSHWPFKKYLSIGGQYWKYGTKRKSSFFFRYVTNCFRKGRKFIRHFVRVKARHWFVAFTKALPFVQYDALEAPLKLVLKELVNCVSPALLK